MINHVENDIIQAFNRLIQKQSFDKLTVTMIAKEAGVGKATFYRHFKDKYDVMNANYKLLLDDLVRREDCHNYRDLIYLLLETSQEKWKPLIRAFDSTGYNSLTNFLYKYTMALTLEIYRQNFPGKPLPDLYRLQAHLINRGMTEVYELWVRGEFDLDAAKTADAIYEMLPKDLRDLWWHIPPKMNM